jgi:hypothetical protein
MSSVTRTLPRPQYKVCTPYSVVARGVDGLQPGCIQEYMTDVIAWSRPLNKLYFTCCVALQIYMILGKWLFGKV